jgi:hypothetical protein
MLTPETILRAFDEMGLTTEDARERFRKLASFDESATDAPREQYFIRMEAHAECAKEGEYAELA